VSIVHTHITICASPQRVWDTVMDPMRLRDWVTIHKALGQVSGPPLLRGATLEQILQLRGVPFRVHWTLEEVDPPRFAQWEGRGPAHSHALIRYRLIEENTEQTRFEYTNQFTPPGGRLGVVASRVIVGAASEREARKSLAKLKALIENEV
jgi:uncharacterized protein YndB with AHSA1/START domain